MASSVHAIVIAMGISGFGRGAGAAQPVSMWFNVAWLAQLCRLDHEEFLITILSR